MSADISYEKSAEPASLFTPLCPVWLTKNTMFLSVSAYRLTKKDLESSVEVDLA